MDGLILLSALVAFGIFGYYVMARIDRFLECVRKQNGPHETIPPLNIAASSTGAIPAITRVLNDIRDQHPDIQCNLFFGKEQEVIQAFDVGKADVAIVSAEVDCQTLAQSDCFTLSPQPQKVLWRKNGVHCLAPEFIRKFCGQER